MKNVLVFGGFGFLGYYLLKELISRKYNVTVADIIINQELEYKVTFIKCDITKKENIQKAFENKTYDYVYNLAGFANLDVAIKFPIKTIHAIS